MQLENESINSLKKIIGEYSFRLNEIQNVVIKVKLFKYFDNDAIFFETSHYIQTPTQAGPYLTNVNSMPTEELALNRALETITSFYTAAIREGYEPSEEWLIVNDFYNED